MYWPAKIVVEYETIHDVEKVKEEIYYYSTFLSSARFPVHFIKILCVYGQLQIDSRYPLILFKIWNIISLPKISGNDNHRPNHLTRLLKF